jgi:hypothetical protein
VQLQNTRLLIGVSECRRILLKADGATKLRHLMFLDRFSRTVQNVGAPTYCAREMRKLYVGAGDNVDEMNLRCC